MDKIFTAKDDAKRKKFAGVGAYVRGLSVQMAQRGLIAFPWDGTTVTGEPVQAIVDHGRWLAVCDRCGNAEYVDPETPIFFCMRCGNGDSRAARPVTFPENREQVEADLLAIEVVPGWGRDDIERALRATPVNGGAGREWTPQTPTLALPQMAAEERGNLGEGSNLGGAEVVQ